MNERYELLGTIVVKKYGGTGENQTTELAAIVTICDAPTYGLIDASGKKYHWRQDLTREATLEEVAKYWRDRAKTAEERLEIDAIKAP